MMSPLAQMENLKEQLAKVSEILADIENRAASANKNRRRARRRSTYFRAALALRKPAANYALWSIGVLTVGPAAALFLTVVLLTILGLPGGLIFWLGLLAAVVAFMILGLMLKHPATDELSKLIADERFLEKQFQEVITRLTTESQLIKQNVALTQTTIQELRQADALKREELLKRKWKAMRDQEWDAYVIEVLAALGAQAEPMADKEHGIDLLVRYGAMMIAVETQGFVGSVGNETVKQAIAGREHYGCDRAAVITNSRFTTPARAFAASHRCFLIGEQEFPAFVMGSNLELFK